jgi:hypothetical protein
MGNNAIETINFIRLVVGVITLVFMMLFFYSLMVHIQADSGLWAYFWVYMVMLIIIQIGMQRLSDISQAHYITQEIKKMAAAANRDDRFRAGLI